MDALLIAGLLATLTPLQDANTTLRVVSLEEAVHTARSNHPTLRQAQSSSAAAAARADESRAGLLPQLTGTGQYQRTTSNFALRPGLVPPAFASYITADSTGTTYNYFNFGLTATQLIYDFGVTWSQWSSAKATAAAQKASEQGTLLTVSLTVRTSYFDAQAQKALLGVAQETLANQSRHLKQIEGFVRVGTRPEIDLAQARTDYANAKVSLVNGENNYETAKARLNQAMGVTGPADYDVSDTPFEPVPGEDLAREGLVEEALRARPEFAQIQQQIEAQEQTLRSVYGNYGPSLGVSAGATEAGAAFNAMVWNWNAQLSLSWNLFQGGLTYAQQNEASANLAGLVAQKDGLGQQVYLDVEQARLAVRAAKASLSAADEALTNARERLRLADRRYVTGVGNAIELGDAQLAMTSAAAQRVQAGFNLSAARAQLVKALGRTD